ncbi:LD-carboxypeptidase [bacterium]|nr:LD-carboxypeptidase [bacterium]
MLLPRALPAKGLIGICSPAGPVKQDKLERAVRRIERSGYRVKLAPNVFGKHGYLSASDEERLSDLHQLFLDPEVDAVFCSRGGYGTSRLLEKADATLIANSRKPFLGFSDTTALQWMIYAETGFVTYTGPLAVEWDDLVSEAACDHAWRVLTQTETGNLFAAFPSESPQRFELLKGRGELHGVLMPGNLAMITTLCGTPYLPDMQDKILFIEDISESPYRFDRMLFQLRNAGILKKLRGLIVGDFGWDGKEGEYEMQRQCLLDVTRGYSYPIMINLPYGHGRDRLTLPVGGSVAAGFDDTPSLRLLRRDGDAA